MEEGHGGDFQIPPNLKASRCQGDPCARCSWYSAATLKGRGGHSSQLTLGGLHGGDRGITQRGPQWDAVPSEPTPLRCRWEAA